MPTAFAILTAPLPLAVVGLGTMVNVATIVVGSLIGLALGNRLRERTRNTVTDVLGLVTIVIGGLSVMSLKAAAFVAAVGASATLVVVLGALLIGALLGSWLRVEDRLEAGGGWLRDRFGGSAAGADGAGRHRFVNGFVTATLVFCVGPLTILGSLSDGLGRGTEQLIVKSILDGFASIAFASALGAGVLASALSVAVIQGVLTFLGWAAGDVMPAAHIDALTATGGIILLGLGIRLLGLKDVRVGDMLPALLVVPLLTQLVAWFS